MKEKILEFCKSLGLDTVGFVKCRRFSELEEVYNIRKDKGFENEFEEQDIEKRVNPNVYMEDGKTIITIAFPYLYDEDYVDNGFSVYTRGMDYHYVVSNFLKKISEYIESLGGRAISLVDSNSLPERYIAYLGNIGFIGKNNMLITKKYGSYVFLGEIITDLEIQCEEERTLEELRTHKECGTCEICYKNCPTKVLNRSKMKNTNSCMSYITQKKDIEDKYLNEIPLKKGAKDFLIKAHSDGYKMCILTTSEKSQAIGALKRTGVLDLFDEIYTDRDFDLSRKNGGITIRYSSV